MRGQPGIGVCLTIAATPSLPSRLHCSTPPGKNLRSGRACPPSLGGCFSFPAGRREPLFTHVEGRGRLLLPIVEVVLLDDVEHLSHHVDFGTNRLSDQS